MRRLIFWLLNINWENYRSASCFPNRCFCEAIGNGLVRQPIDAYSNFAYVIAGLIILYNLLRTRKLSGKTTANSDLPRAILIIFGLATIAVGVGSFFYHASFTFAGMEMDDDAMYLAGSFMLLFFVSFFKDISKTSFIAYYLSMNLLLALVIYLHPSIRGDLFALIIMIALYLEEKAIRKKVVFGNLKHLYLSVGLLLFGFFFWFVDYRKLLCFPESVFQGHALWHIFTAAAMVKMYFYMDSEYLPQGILGTNLLLGRIRRFFRQ